MSLREDKLAAEFGVSPRDLISLFPIERVENRRGNNSRNGLRQNVGTSRSQEQEIFHNLSVRSHVITYSSIVSSPSLTQVVWFLKGIERRLGSSHHRDHVAHAKYGCRKEHLSLAWKFVTKCPFCVTWLLNHLYQYMAPSAEYHGNGYRGLRTQKRRMFMFTHSPLADTETSESRPGIKVFLEAVLLCTVFSISF